MAAPLLRTLVPLNTPEERLHREIENHYHLEVGAQSAQQLAKSLGELSEINRQAAVVNLRTHAELAQRMDAGNRELEAANSLLRSLSRQLDETNAGILDVADAVAEQTAVVEAGFERLAKRMLKQQAALEEIAVRLRRPNEQHVQELLDSAHKAVVKGTASSGKDQEERFAYAERALSDALSNRVGEGNYVAWYQMGWLKWKFRSDLPEAERAFYLSALHAEGEGNACFPDSLRHLAYMQYLQGKLEEAYATIQRALAVSEEPEVLFDAARYAARIGKTQEAVALLERCIAKRPDLHAAMLAEEDFIG